MPTLAAVYSRFRTMEIPRVNHLDVKTINEFKTLLGQFKYPEIIDKRVLFYFVFKFVTRVFI